MELSDKHSVWKKKWVDLKAFNWLLPNEWNFWLKLILSENKESFWEKKRKNAKYSNIIDREVLYLIVKIRTQNSVNNDRKMIIALYCTMYMPAARVQCTATTAAND